MSRTEQKMPVFDKVTDIDYFMPSLHRTFKYSVLTFFISSSVFTSIMKNVSGINKGFI